MRASFEAVDRAAGDVQAARSEVIAMRDVDAESAAIQHRYKERYEHLKATAPEGMEPNTVSLDLRMDQEIEALREAARNEAAALAPDVDADADLDGITTDFADVLPRLVSPEVRRSLAMGREFVRRPEVRGVFGGPVQSSTYIYGSHERDEAFARHDALVAALAILGGSRVLTIGEEADRASRPN